MLTRMLPNSKYQGTLSNSKNSSLTHMKKITHIGHSYIYLISNNWPETWLVRITTVRPYHLTMARPYIMWPLIILLKYIAIYFIGGLHNQMSHSTTPT